MVLNFRGGLMVGLDADAGYRATASVLLVAVVGAAQTCATDVSAHRYRYRGWVGTMPSGRVQSCCVYMWLW